MLTCTETQEKLEKLEALLHPNNVYALKWPILLKRIHCNTDD